MGFDHKAFVNMLEAIKEHLKLDMQIIGDNPGMNFPGTPGKSLEFEWKGTKLGIRVEGDKNYKYVDLKGTDGEAPHIDPVTNHWFVGTVDTGVDASGSRGADGVTPNLKIGTITTLPSGSRATATISGTSANPVLNLGIPKGDTGNDAANTDEKLKLTAASAQAKYMSDLIDNTTIVIDSAKGTIKAVSLEGLQATVTKLNFIKNLDRDIMTYLSAISNPMGFKGVVADDNALAAVSGAMNGDTYIVKSSVSNGGKTMTFIYNGTDFVPIAETTVSVRDFTTNPLDLATEVTGILGDAYIAASIARKAEVLDKTTYEGSTVGSVKQADKLTGMTATGAQVDEAINKTHSHGNKDALDKILDTGDGNLVLTDDGSYQRIFHVGNIAPLNTGFFWVDTTVDSKPVLKFHNGTIWVPVSSSSSGGSAITVDTAMSASSTNPVQNKVVKKYVDDAIPGVSSNTGNAISTDDNGDFFCEDKTPDIKENTDRIKEIEKHKKFLNSDMTYCSLGFRNDSAVLGGGLSRYVNVKINTDIPFDKVYNDGGIEYNLTNHSVHLKAGCTYELTGQTKTATKDDGHIIRFYNLTDSVYLNHAARVYTVDESNHIEEIITPTKDIDVTLRLAWCNTSNVTVRMRTSVINNNPGGLGISSSQTRVNEVYMIAKEIGRTITVDPLDYVNTEDGIEDTPIGTILPLMANHAPAHYLECDGAVYNITEYPHLSQHIKTEFGSFNYWGGDGITTFAVPDLRGEFLRGTGKATRNTGMGGSVGSHQNPTKHAGVFTAKTTSVSSDTRFFMPAPTPQNPSNSDTFAYATHRYNGARGESTAEAIANNCGFYTSRPTNTAVRWCIKAEPTYFMKVEGKDCYSEEEQIVGYWINNKPLYQKTIVVNEIYSTTEKTVKHNIPDIEFAFVHLANAHQSGSGMNNFLPMYYPGAQATGTGAESTLFITLTDINIRTLDIRSGCTGYITIRYTKKSDFPRA